MPRDILLQQNQVTIVHTQEQICAAILPRNKLRTQQQRLKKKIHVTFSACIFCSFTSDVLSVLNLCTEIYFVFN